MCAAPAVSVPQNMYLPQTPTILAHFVLVGIPSFLVGVPCLCVGVWSQLYMLYLKWYDVH